MTQNRHVWLRRSKLKPPGTGQVQHWFSRKEYEAMLRPFFRIEHVATFHPGGDTGMLWWVENRYVRHAMGILLGRRRWQSLLESIGLGMELVFVARRAES